MKTEKSNHMKKVLIIAEAGVNHNGNMSLAYLLIDEAKRAGADIVKFQTAVPELVMTQTAAKAEYQKDLTGENESQLEMAKKIHLPLSAYAELKKYCDKKDILFLSSPFDMVSIDLLEELDMPIYKIPSGEITNYPYLRKIGSLAKKVIISTGMAKIGEIEEAINLLIESGTKKEDINVLHCTTEYPAPFQEINLRAMQNIAKTFQVKVGYSDHTEGIEVPIAAVAMGAEIIEKHFTLDKTMEGPDHKASLEPYEFKKMVISIRNIEQSLGSYIKQPSPSEIKNMEIARKSIVAAKAIKKGELFTEDNLCVKRPGSGLNPMMWKYIIGKRAYKDYSEDQLI